MDVKIIVAIVTSVFSLIGAAFAALFSFTSQKRLKRLESELKQRAESADFLAAKLDKFYLPMSMHLRANDKLFKRFFKAGGKEKEAIEHEWREHNSKVREYLMNSAIYVEPDAPEADLDALLEHLIQWDIVYKLKYEHEVYDGPVFAGIEDFGFRGFPRKKPDEGENIDEYFRRKVNELRSRHHQRLQLNP